METIEMLKAAKRAADVMSAITPDVTSKVLHSVADALVANADEILEANRRDLSAMDPKDSKYDRLALSVARIESIASDMHRVAELPAPAWRVLETIQRPNGMVINKISVPLGVVGVIYEARPNVTADVFSLCLRSGNVAVLKSGSDAAFSSQAIADVICRELGRFSLPQALCTLLPSTRQAASQLLSAKEYVDVIIPRGSSGLIKFVRENASLPVIETGAGVCHQYFHQSGDLKKGRDLLLNAKTRRVSVCNALDTLIIDRCRLADLKTLAAPLADKSVKIYADEDSYAALQGAYPYLERTEPDSFGREYLGYSMSIKSVGRAEGGPEGLQEAIAHIAKYGSGHSESIVAEDKAAAEEFTRRVDASCVYVNLPTSFTDGGEFGFGAEIGISTQKLHARGPMALRELTTYKYVISGNGQIRS